MKRGTEPPPPPLGSLPQDPWLTSTCIYIRGSEVYKWPNVAKCRMQLLWIQIDVDQDPFYSANKAGLARYTTPQTPTLLLRTCLHVFTLLPPPPPPLGLFVFRTCLPGCELRILSGLQIFIFALEEKNISILKSVLEICRLLGSWPANHHL